MQQKIGELEARGRLAESAGRYMEAANYWRLALELCDSDTLRAEHERILGLLRQQFADAVRRPRAANLRLRYREAG